MVLSEVLGYPRQPFSSRSARPGKAGVLHVARVYGVIVAIPDVQRDHE